MKIAVEVSFIMFIKMVMMARMLKAKNMATMPMILLLRILEVRESSMLTDVVELFPRLRLQSESHLYLSPSVKSSLGQI